MKGIRNSMKSGDVKRKLKCQKKLLVQGARLNLIEVNSLVFIVVLIVPLKKKKSVKNSKDSISHTK